jgi:creatinine amidohydrolase
METLESVPNPPNLRKAEEITYTDVLALPKDRTVCFCAVSALEVHGPHLPIGADYHQAVWMADETARRFAERHPDWTVLRYPPLPVGTDEVPLPGSINMPARVVYDVVRSFGDQLARAGFRYIVLTNAHGGPRHAAGLEAACRKVSRKHGVAMFTPAIRALHRMVTGSTLEEVEARIGRSLTDEERKGLVSGEHAGTWETAWYLARRPDLVKPDYKNLGLDGPPRFAPLASAGERIAGWLDRVGRKGAAEAVRTTCGGLAGSVGWMLNARSGYGRNDGERVTYQGWPAVATSEVGAVYADMPVEMCLQDLEAVVEGRVRPGDVRSIASDPVVIQPWFFRVTAVGVAGLFLLAAWALS